MVAFRMARDSSVREVLEIHFQQQKVIIWS